MKRLGKTMIKDLISVLMPTYNVEAYIEEAVNSILIQTYKNFELIIVDDCSTDKTFEILQKISRKDKRIRLFHNKTNQKICKTLNFALKQACGEYIARMDGDDISTSTRLELLKEFLEQNKDHGLVGSQVLCVDENGNLLNKSKLLQTHCFLKFFNLFQSNILHIWLAKREVYENLNGYRNLLYVEDYDFVLRAIRMGYKVANLPDYLYSVRIRNGNTAATNGLKQNKAKIFLQKQYLGSEFDSENITIKYNFAVQVKRNELKKFRIAYNYLLNAMLSKSGLSKLYYAIKSFCYSYYLFRSTLISHLIKIFAIIENLLIKLLFVKK